MDLHGRMMNLPVEAAKLGVSLRTTTAIAYKTGHKDARHAAAEVALQADACIESLREIVELGLLSGDVESRARSAIGRFDGVEPSALQTPRVVPR